MDKEEKLVYDNMREVTDEVVLSSKRGGWQQSSSFFCHAQNSRMSTASWETAFAILSCMDLDTVWAESRNSSPFLRDS